MVGNKFEGMLVIFSVIFADGRKKSCLHVGRRRQDIKLTVLSAHCYSMRSFLKGLGIIIAARGEGQLGSG